VCQNFARDQSFPTGCWFPLEDLKSHNPATRRTRKCFPFFLGVTDIVAHISGCFQNWTPAVLCRDHEVWTKLSGFSPVNSLPLEEGQPLLRRHVAAETLQTRCRAHCGRSRIGWTRCLRLFGEVFGTNGTILNFRESANHSLSALYSTA